MLKDCLNQATSPPTPHASLVYNPIKIFLFSFSGKPKGALTRRGGEDDLV
jgi:hypothetical protein